MTFGTTTSKQPETPAETNKTEGRETQEGIEFNRISCNINWMKRQRLA
jgi:hypothetical protein